MSEPLHSALSLVPQFGEELDAFRAAGLPGVAILDKNLGKLISKSKDDLGARWAALKAIDEAEGKLKAEADTISRLRGHLDGLKARVRLEAAALLEGEPDQKVMRPEFSASLVATTSLEGPKNVLDWPECFRRKIQKVEPDKAGALARLKAGEEFEGLRLVENKSVRFF